MKYKDLIMIFMALLFFFSLGFTVGVNSFYWFIPVLILVFILVLYYKLWIEK